MECACYFVGRSPVAQVSIFGSNVRLRFDLQPNLNHEIRH